MKKGKKRGIASRRWRKCFSNTTLLFSFFLPVNVTHRFMKVAATEALISLVSQLKWNEDLQRRSKRSKGGKGTQRRVVERWRVREREGEIQGEKWRERGTERWRQRRVVERWRDRAMGRDGERKKERKRQIWHIKLKRWMISFYSWSGHYSLPHPLEWRRQVPWQRLQIPTGPGYTLREEAVQPAQRADPKPSSPPTNPCCFLWRSQCFGKFDVIWFWNSSSTFSLRLVFAHKRGATRVCQGQKKERESRHASKSRSCVLLSLVIFWLFLSGLKPLLVSL